MSRAIVDQLFMDDLKEGEKESSCYIKIHDGMAMVCTPDGEVIPGQKGMTINLPMNDVVTVNLEIVIAGVEKP